MNEGDIEPKCARPITLFISAAIIKSGTKSASMEAKKRRHCVTALQMLMAITVQKFNSCVSLRVAMARKN